MNLVIRRKEQLWVAWVAANSAAWIAMMLLFPVVGTLLGQLVSLPAGWVFGLNIPESTQSLLSLVMGTLHSFAVLALEGAVLGVVLGLAQWLVLREWMPRAQSWVAATALGSAIGLSVGMMATLVYLGESSATFEDVMLRGLVLGGAVGVSLGFAQWAVLRRITRMANRWLLASPVGWTAGLTTSWALAWLVGPIANPPPELAANATRVALSSLIVVLIPGIVAGAVTSLPLKQLRQFSPTRSDGDHGESS